MPSATSQDRDAMRDFMGMATTKGWETLDVEIFLRSFPFARIFHQIQSKTFLRHPHVIGAVLTLFMEA